MVVALFGLSLVMILGGLASVIQGFPYVRLESGLAMVIGGATAASAGVVLLGLTAVVMRLQRIESLLAAARGDVASEPYHDIGALSVSTAPALAGAAGLAGLTVGNAGVAEQRPSVVLPERAAEGEPHPSPSNEEMSVAPPDAGATSSREPAIPAEPALEDDLFAAADSGLVAPPRPVLEEPNPAETQKSAEGKNQVVGTYASGGNTYVMFADGTIEADTPRGRFTFRSLEELKTFVQAGGESDTRGAA